MTAVAIAGVIVSAVITVVSAEDFCSVDMFTLPQGPRFLRFSKELSEAEFAVVGNFMSLHCCAAAFRTVEWFKDGRPYPWTGDVSSLIINPASHNQTIYTQSVTPADTGRYHCLVSNSTSVLRHQVQLTVAGSFSSVGPPKATYSPKDQYLKVGDTARLYCEAYVGNIKLPDARSDIVWTKEKEETTESLSARHNQRVIYREGKRVLGSYLTVTELQTDDFGRYYCTVSNTGDQFLQLSATLHQIIEESSSNDTTLRLCLGIGFAALSTIILLVTIYRCRLFLRMSWKNLRQMLYSLEDDEVDVEVMYHERDAAYALGVIIPTLQEKYHYTCSCRQLPLLQPLNSSDVISRRLLAIITPVVTKDVWTAASVCDTVLMLLSLHPKVICLLLQDLPVIDIKTVDGRRLKEALSRVHFITLNEAQSKDFWMIVQLGLPLQKKHRNRQGRGSLENLM